jgi:hypothetical protein
MSRAYRVKTDTPAEALALAQVITAEGGWATYLVTHEGPVVLASCRAGVLDGALSCLNLPRLLAA